MKSLFLYIVCAGIFWLVGCSDNSLINPKNYISIPDDPLAFYLIEGYQDHMDLKTITIDSIKKFGNRIIGYNEIIKYDTSNFIFELTASGRESVDSLCLARYARHFPIAVISEGEFLFAVYISHSACSSIATWYSLQPYYELNYPNNYIYFSPPPPPFIYFSKEPDFRTDSRMLHVLVNGNKLK